MYISLILTIFFWLIYALPNFYGEDLAVQTTGIHGVSINNRTLTQVKDALRKENISSTSIILSQDKILSCFSTSEDQLRAQEVLINTLGKQYLVSLNLVPATPKWLSTLGAKPMKLGFDLRGGIHFLIEVNTKDAISNLESQSIDALYKTMKEYDVTYIKVEKIKNECIKIYFYDKKNRDKAISLISSKHRDLDINIYRDNVLRMSISKTKLHRYIEYIVQQNINILRHRINELGISESLVQRQGVNRITVELPGIQDSAQAKEILGTTATLEFHLVNNETNTSTTINNYIPENSEIKLTRDGKPVLLYKHILINGSHIINAISSLDEYHLPQVNIFLNKSGGDIMFKITKDNIGKPIAVLFTEYKENGKKDNNGKSILVKQEEIINIAVIQSQLRDNFRITGINNLIEARRLALLLRAGALVSPIQIIEERTIGPTLGMKNIAQGLKACCFGMIASILFMVIWYRKFGLIAISAIAVNFIIIIGMMSLLPGVTLTMPGIAGIVLTLAIAVDANILINERIKEELRNGKSIQYAIYEGYRIAFSSIIDANVMTFIISIILYVIGTGSVKSFAITSSIGTISSMFTSTIGTRAIVNLIYGGSKRINKLSI